jgi:hypothetical protein
MGAPRFAAPGLIVLLSLACMSEPVPVTASLEVAEDEEALRSVADAAASEPAAMPDAVMEKSAARPAAAPRPAPAMKPGTMEGGDRDIDVSRGRRKAEEAQAEEAVREWFPEAFLWAPIVETDDDGLASLEITVPDSLTEWRVLGLAHDLGGQQAGAVHTFASRLPVSVDLALPAQLRTGDVLELPVRAVNGTDGPLTASLRLEASGALVGAGGSTATLGSGGVARTTVRLTAARAGEASLSASVQGGGETDRVERSLRVVPLGTPSVERAGGTVRDRVALALPKPAGGGADEELRVTVHPGPLALLQGELERVSAGGRTGLPGAGIALSSRVASVAEAAGVQVDEALTRRVKLLGWQGLVRDLGRAGPREAVDLLHAVGATDDLGGVEAARPNLVARVVQAQRPDGTWSWADRSTLQRVVVDTIHAARALPESEAAARLRAQGACERHAPALAKDPYTAAVLVGSGMISGPTAEPLLALIEEALVRDDAGVPSVSVPSDVVDAWGARPSKAEMLAWTVLALPADHPDRGPLAAELVGMWSPGRGFGAGRADGVVLDAVLASVPGITSPTTVSIEVDGEIVATAALDPTKPRQAASLVAAPGQEMHLVVDPPVGGVAWSAERRTWVPLDPGASLPGLEIEVTTPKPLRAGEQGEVVLTVAAPRLARVTLEQALPAGAVVDPEPLRRDSDVASVVVGPDMVEIASQPFAASAMDFVIPVTPAFGGRFSTDPLQVRVDGRAPVALPALTWVVAP